MAYKLTVTPQSTYLHIQVSGENSARTVTDYIHEVGDLCEKENFSTVLLEENLEGPGLTMFDIVKVIKGLRSSPKVLH